MCGRPLATARAAGAGWIVLDGYHFDGSFQDGLVAGGRRVLALDDYCHAGWYHADLVLNQNAGAEAVLYANRAPTTVLLLGPRFALLREEFREWSGQHRRIPLCARRVVVTLGGSDPTTSRRSSSRLCEQCPARWTYCCSSARQTRTELHSRLRQRRPRIRSRSPST